MKFDNTKRIFLFSLFFFLLIGSVSAIEYDNSDNVTTSNDLIVIEEENNDQNTLINEDKNGINEIQDSKSFNNIQESINKAESGDVINLNGHYISSGKKDFITVSKTVTIDGHGTTIIDGNNTSRLLQINADNIIIKNIQFVNGFYQDEKPTVINLFGNNVTIINCNFYNNKNPTMMSDYWGAINCHGDNNNIIECSFSNNYAGSASSIAIFGSNNKIIDSNFSNNEAHWLGGAIHLYGQNNIVNNCNFINNTAGNGGAISTRGDKNDIINCLFSRNTANHDSYYNDGLGGAIYQLGDNCLIKNNNFDNNNALMGGAIYSCDDLNNIIEDCTFNNHKASFGSVIYKHNSSNLTVNKLIIEKSKVEPNDYVNLWGHPGKECAIYLNGKNINISNSKFVKNNAISLDTDIIKSSIKNCIFDSNEKRSLNIDNDYAILINNTFINNIKGALFCRGNNCIVTNSTFTNNKAEDGAAIDWYGLNGSIINSTFTGNKATNMMGGAILIYKDNCMIENNIFKNNNAVKYGGAIYVSVKNVTVDKSIFIYNAAGDLGGAIYSTSTDTLVTNSIFINNTAVIDNDIYGEIRTENITFGKMNTTILLKQIGNTFENTLIFITLIDLNRNPISNQKLSIKLSNGITSEVKTDENGTATYELKNDVGSYSLNISGINEIYNIAETTLNNINIEPINSELSASKITTTFLSENQFQVKIIDKTTKKALSNVKLSFKIFTGKKYKIYYSTTNQYGIAKINTKILSVGKHNVQIKTFNKNYKSNTLNSQIIIAKIKTNVKAPKVVSKYKKSKKFKITVLNKNSKKPIKNIKLKIKVYSGKKYKMYKIKLNKKGMGAINTKTLKIGNHKVVINSANSNYEISKTSKIIIKK